VKLLRGEELVLRGAVEVGSNTSGFTKRINFFDGDYKHGYKVTRFVVGVNASGSFQDVIGKLTTAEPADPNDAWWNWANAQEIGWAAFTMDATVTPGEGWSNGNSLVSRDNLIIEDLYITVRSRDIGHPYVYYYIELDKYELEPFRGTLSIVENMSQG